MVRLNAEARQSMNSKLEGLAIDELRHLECEVPKVILRKEREARRIAFEKVEKCAAGLGLSRADLQSRYGAEKAASDAVSAVKYRDPETGSTWSGRGRRPRWVKEFEANGGKLSTLRVVESGE